MKKIVTILLVIALYAPQIGSILLYTQCSLEVILKQENRFCDCELNSIQPPIANGLSFPGQQHELKDKTDWKYIAGTEYQFCNYIPDFDSPFTIYNNTLSSGFASTVFHPPASSQSFIS